MHLGLDLEPQPSPRLLHPDPLVDRVQEAANLIGHIARQSKSRSASYIIENITAMIEYTLERELIRPIHHTVRKDGSVFVSMSSFYDNDCSQTLQSIFEYARHPSNIKVGLSQHGDCYERFCVKSPQHCSKVRSVQLGESILGNFIDRFLPYQFWEGESLYLQIDSHTTLRPGWDDLLWRTLKNIPGFPNVGITTYPEMWSDDPWDRPYYTNSLCRMEFRENGMWSPSQSRERLSSSAPVPSLFVAAGYLAIPLQALNASFPYGLYDPFIPFVFEEEVVLTSRLWKAGISLFAPHEEHVRHNYNASQRPHLWDAIDQMYGKSQHVSLVNLARQRLFAILGAPHNALGHFASARLSEFGLSSDESRMFWKHAGIKNGTVVAQEAPKWCH